MSVEPLTLYSSGLRSQATQGLCACGTWQLRYSDGRRVPLALAQWCGDTDRADRDVLTRCREPVLDIGCGPGRMVAALTSAGRQALGVDIAETSVRLARAAGAAAVRRSVFEVIPAEGTWGTILLLDGNIGIGGDPLRLLQRCAELTGPHGKILVELDPPGQPSAAVTVRIESPHETSDWFSWAHVAADHIATLASRSELRVSEEWMLNGRWFASLAR